MRILITNDDSINAQQLLPLVKYCRKYGDVTVAVPKNDQSGKSHGIELRNDFTVEKTVIDGDVTAYVIDSTPADCVRYALFGVDLKFDIVISGINKGYNIGSDINYSGTVSAVREAALQGINAVSLSTCPENYDRAVEQLDEIVRFVFFNGLLQKHIAYNINVPPMAKGIKITRQGGIYYSDTFEQTRLGYYKAKGTCAYMPSDDLTLDTNAVTFGYVSITPISIDMTENKVFDELSGILNK